MTDANQPGAHADEPKAFQMEIKGVRLTHDTLKYTLVKTQNGETPKAESAEGSDQTVSYINQKIVTTESHVINMNGETIPEKDWEALDLIANDLDKKNLVYAHETIVFYHEKELSGADKFLIRRWAKLKNIEDPFAETPKTDDFDLVEDFQTTEYEDRPHLIAAYKSNREVAELYLENHLSMLPEDMAFDDFWLKLKKQAVSGSMPQKIFTTMMLFSMSDIMNRMVPLNSSGYQPGGSLSKEAIGPGD